ncbi:MAG TPA: preprotein translocase subunit SecY [Dehalococcoidales bacterium]|nr:preprotein translocase subunit SecY [Dehalococcoidales bacterium]
MRQKPSRPRLIQAMIDAFRLPDLRKRILITLGLLVAFRLIAAIPLPGVDVNAMTQYFNNSALLGMLNLLSGGGMKNFSIVAMGVYPYITSTIILQLLTPVIPALQNMSQEGEAGRNRMNRISHWLTIPLAALSGYGQIMLLKSQTINGTAIIGATTPLQMVTMITILVAGTMFLVWLGELITDYGIGNGVSIIIFAGIITGYPNSIRQAILASQGGNIIGLIVFGIIVLATIVLIVIFTEAHRRIPVQYARTQFKSGRMYRSTGGTHIPLRVNSAGMIPLIFSMSLVIFPGMIAQYFPNNDFAKLVVKLFSPGTALPLGFVYWGLYFVLTIFFGFFYTYVIFQEQDLPGTLQRQGGFIPGIRPGKATEQYLNNVVTKITLAGALFLAVVAIVPFIARGVGNMQAVQVSSMGLLIMVGVVLDTMKQMEAQLTMRRYEGFIK